MFPDIGTIASVLPIDRLSSLPDELLLIVFEHLRLVSDKQSLKPLSRSLQVFQRINLYHTVRMEDCVTLAKFDESLHGTTGLGHLVQHLDIFIQEGQVKRFHQENETILAGIRDLVPHLRSIRCPVASTVGDIFLDQIRAFGELEVVGLSTRLSKYIHVLEMKNLKEVDLRVLNDENLEAVIQPARNVRQLSLDSLVIYARTPSPLLLHFLRSIKAKDVTLNAGNYVNVMAQSLAALDHSITSHMTLRHIGDSPFILDSQLDRFTLLRHLTLGQDINVKKSFFKAIFETPLISLRLNKYFNLDAQNLIDALKDPDSAKQLEELELSNIEFLSEACGSDSVGLLDHWTDNCTIEHIAELRSIAGTSGFQLCGTTIRAEQISWRIMEAWENTEAWDEEE